MKNKIFGLIGNPIKHSFSKIYFEDKFLKQNIRNCEYQLFELQSIKEITYLLNKETNLCGFNVTSPYKIQILHYLTSVSEEINFIGAVNTVKIQNNNLIGYNTDYMGFLNSLKSQTNIKNIHSALILGSGGASKAISYALKQNNIKYILASTNIYCKKENTISYKTLNELKSFDMFDLIVNATPCGMETYPPMAEINTDKINSKHIVFDLIYNPAKTLLLIKAEQQGAKIINGLQMLYNQAEESWKIWNNSQ